MRPNNRKSSGKIQKCVTKKKKYPKITDKNGDLDKQKTNERERRTNKKKLKEHGIIMRLLHYIKASFITDFEFIEPQNPVT